MKLPSVIPTSWKIGAALALVAAAIAAGVAYRSHVYQLGFDAAVSERAGRDLRAVVGRVQDNAALEAKHGAINITITKAKHEELAPVRARIAADRVRVGAAICDGPAATTETESATSSNGTDPAGRLVRPDIDRDLRALKLAVEEHLATGRACQAFVRENGLEP